MIHDLLERDSTCPAQPVRGLDALKAAVSGFDLARTSALTGLSESELLALRQGVTDAGPIIVETGTGVTMSASANVTQWFAWALMILTGAMNREGGVWFHPGFINRLDTFELPIFADPRHPGAPSRPDVPGMLGEWPCVALPDEIEAGNIRALINLGGSMVRSFPDANRLVPALEKLDVLATFEIVANETTALSSHVLPTKSQLERADITLWDMLSSRLSAYHTPAVLNPQGSRRSSWWVLAELMRRMGIAVPDDVPRDDRADRADEAMLVRLCGNARAGYAEIAANGYIEHPLEFPGKWVDAHIERFGGWDLAPAPLASQLAELLEKSGACDDGTLLLTPRRQRRHLNAALLFLGDMPEALIHPVDALAAGVVTGDKVTLSSSEGAIAVPVRVDGGVRRGTISVPHGHRHANVNQLTTSRIADPLTGMALYGGFPVRIAKQF